MEHDKKYSAREAAIAVLKKAEEVLKKSEMMKQPSAPALKPEADATPPDGVQSGLPQSPEHNGNPEWGTDPGVKGHYKLAKFLGRMGHKRTLKQGLGQ